MAIISIRSAAGAATKSYLQDQSTQEYVSVLTDTQGNHSLGNESPTGLSNISEIEYKGGGTGYQCEVDTSIEYVDTNGKRFWGAITGTRRRR